MEWTEDETRFSVWDLVSRAQYEYDFGDNRIHRVTLVGVQPTGKLPRCVAGERACPPEDCGGMFGFYRLLDTLADSEHEEHERMERWLGGKFDVDAVNAALHPGVPAGWVRTRLWE